jgi:hypothetical protein
LLKHCLACSREFPTSSELEWLTVGRKVAFDPMRGRLWVVCQWCGHWSLVPMDHRWEAVEELERLAHTRATVLGTTDQVSLLDLGAVEAVRIGRAPGREEAWWRYGREFRGRRLRYNMITRTGGTAAAIVVGTAVACFTLLVPDVALARWRTIRAFPGQARNSGSAAAESFERWFRYGRVAWQGAVPCQACGHVLTALPFSTRGTALLQPDRSVQVPCDHCRSADGRHVIAGRDGEQIVRRLLAYENIAGADDRQLDAAVQLIRSGQVRAPGAISLRGARRETLVGLELLLAEQREARLLGWEIADLQARWEIAEELARIIDRELTPVPDSSSLGTHAVSSEADDRGVMQT